MTAEHIPAVKKLLLPSWQRSWNEELCDRFFQWRFQERENGEGILAFDGSHCVAMIDSWIRPYVLGDQIISVREPADWYCLPGYRGLGLRPMWKLMEKPEPILSVGGTEATRTLLPRLQWKPLTPVTNYMLPLASGVMVEAMLKRLRPPCTEILIHFGHKLSFRVRKPYLHPPPVAGGMVLQHNSCDSFPTIIPSTKCDDLVPLCTEGEFSWLSRAPEQMGEFIFLVFSLNGSPIGFTVSRLFQLTHLTEARLLHIQTSEESIKSYAWLVAETAHELSRRGAHLIRCRATCSIICKSLKMTGFLERSQSPVFWWSRDKKVPEGTIRLTWLRGDDGIEPYPL